MNWLVDWLIRRAMRAPYDHLVIQTRTGKILRISDSTPLWPGVYWYMRRFWLLRLGPLQIRLHHILAEDPGRDHHDHPWPFRSVILRGWYLEQREGGRHFRREAGDTYRMKRGEFHRIVQVADGGAWTMFITWGARRGWGFKRADGSVVPHGEY
jgi:hypothetical protein